MKNGLIKTLLLTATIISINSCNQEKFYKKDFLKQKFPTPQKDASDKNIEPPVIPPNVVNNIIPIPKEGGNDNNGGGQTVINPTLPPVPTIVPPPEILPIPSCKITAVSENFNTQQNNTKVDILWIIDNSGSMGDEQKNLRKNLATFIDKFLKKNIDFKMSVITTDDTRRHSGEFLGKLDFLTNAEAENDHENFIKEFKRWTNVGTWGSGKEKGFNTSLNFLYKYGSSFVRPDAYFIPIFLSDEEEQSGYSVDAYLKAISKYKSLDKVRSYSIVTTKGKKHQRWETEGSRYTKASNDLHGETFDIDDDFAGSLDIISNNIININRSFKLKNKPENKVKVFLDDLELTVDKYQIVQKSNGAISVDLQINTNITHLVTIKYDICQ